MILGPAAALTFLAFLSAAPAAGNPLHDIDLSWAPLEPTGCRAWQPNTLSTWNFSLAANGSDTSLNTTEVHVWITPTSSALASDGWQLSLSAEGDASASPPSFNSSRSRTNASGLEVFQQAPPGVALYLYSANYSPPAPVTTLRLWVVANEDSLNLDHQFNITAQSRRSGQPNITRNLALCLNVPPKPRYTLENLTGTIQASADSYAVVSFRLVNTGNTPDYYLCNLTVSGQPWFTGFTAGVAFTAGVNRTATLEPNAALVIRITVYVPISARAYDNATVSLSCIGYKVLSSGVMLFPYEPYARIEVPLYRWICHTIRGDPTIAALPGDRVVFNLSFENRGNGEDTGVARLVYGNQSWLEALEPPEFTLAAAGDPGSSTLGTLTLVVPEGTALDNFEFRINVTSATGPAPICTARFTVQVGQFYGLLALGGGSFSIDFGEELTGPFLVKNTGNGVDLLMLELIAEPGWVIFLDPAVNSIQLPNGQEASFRVRIIPPPETRNATAGAHSVAVRVISHDALVAGSDLHQDVLWNIAMRPYCRLEVLPPDYYAEVNPGASASGPFRASWPIVVRNLGNAAAVVVFDGSGAPEVPLRSSFNETEIALGESIDGWVTAEISREQPRGLLDIPIKYTACGGAAIGRAWIHVLILSLDVELGPTVKASVQDPEDPTVASPAREATSLRQVEGYRIEFTVRVLNRGDVAVLPSSFELTVVDDFDCPGTPQAEAPVHCGPTQLQSVRLQSVLQPGEERWLSFEYTVPAFVCFENRPCGPSHAPDNIHTLRLRAVAANESDLGNNELAVEVFVLSVPADPAPSPTGGGAIALVAESAALLFGALGLAVVVRRGRGRAAGAAPRRRGPSKRK